MCGVPVQGTVSVRMHVMILTVLSVNMLINITTVVKLKTLSTCSTIILIPSSIKYSISGEWIGGQPLMCVSICTYC